MSSAHLHIGTFNAGELSPLMGARFQVEKVRAGCRLLRNFIPHVHGPAFRRPGMEDMGAAGSNGEKSSLRGFNYSTTTSAVLEFHPDGLRVWSNGLLVTLVDPVTLPYSEAECAEVQMVQVNDVVYLAHPNYTPRKLTRVADDDWTIEEIDWVWPPMGDENVVTEEVATVTTIPVDSCLWPEFDGPTGADTMTVTVANAPTTGTHSLKVYYWDGAAWVEVVALAQSWTTIAPTPTSTAVIQRTAWRIELGGDFLTDDYTASTCTVTADWTVPGVDSFVLSVVDGWPTYLREIHPQTGSIQPYTVGTTIPAGATAKIQKWSGAAWVDAQTLTLTAATTVYGSSIACATGDRFRMLWAGRAMNFMTLSTFGVRNTFYPSITVSASATAGSGITLTASDDIFEAGHVGSYWQITHRRDLSGVDIVPAASPFVETASNPLTVNGIWEVFTYGTWDATLYLERKIGDGWETVRSWVSADDRNVSSTGESENGTVLRLRVSAGTYSGGTPARFVLECGDARVNGLVKVTGFTDSMHVTADVIEDLHATTATALWTEGAWSTVAGFPRSVGIHGQRIWWGGTEREPSRLWGSVVNDYENFLRGSNDDDSVSFTIASGQQNQINWLGTQGDNLVIGTGGDEWTLSGGTDQGPITPVSVSVKRRSAYGSQYLPCQLVGDTIAFIQRGGLKVRSAGERQDQISWNAIDLTVLAEHVTEGGVVQTAVMTFPNTILWLVTGTGKLVGMTFEPDQNVFAWHVHDTDGTIESVAVINGDESDEVWLSVLRAGVRRIERMHGTVFARDFSAPEDLIYLDSAKVVTNAPASATISGLSHLNGKAVLILGDGVEYSGTVSGGAVTISTAVTTAIVGLAFTSKLQPMRIELPLQDGTAQHRKWRTSRVALYVHNTCAAQVGDSETSRFETLEFSGLTTGEKETAIESNARPGADVVVKTSSAHPLNVGSITLFQDLYDA